MKANVKKAWDMLSDKQRNSIIETLRQNMYDEWDEQLCDTQITWIKMSVCNMFEAGVPIDTIWTYLGMWKNMYRYNARLKTKAEQDTWLKPQLDKIFGPDGFPEEFVESLRNIGR